MFHQLMHINKVTWIKGMINTPRQFKRKLKSSHTQPNWLTISSFINLSTLCKENTGRDPILETAILILTGTITRITYL